MEPQVGLEPTTIRLTAERSAVELLRQVRGNRKPLVHHGELMLLCFAVIDWGGVLMKQNGYTVTTIFQKNADRMFFGTDKGLIDEYTAFVRMRMLLLSVCTFRVSALCSREQKRQRSPRIAE